MSSLLYCSTSATLIPPSMSSFHYKLPQNLITHIGFSPKFNLSSSTSTFHCSCSSSSSVMEDSKKVCFDSEAEEYSKELDVAVRAVQMACSLCQKVQESLIVKSKSDTHVQSKDDNSPVTVAGICYLIGLLLLK